jgi:hypothetical protein
VTSMTSRENFENAIQKEPKNENGRQPHIAHDNSAHKQHTVV